MTAIDAIVIGTSAGGIEALSGLLPSLHGGYGGAVFIVLHLPRERPSLLVDIFTPKCALTVREAEDKELVAAGTVYFAPPDYHMLIDNGPQVSLSADEPVHFSRPSVDVLFESAAEVYGERLLGILLTGASADGAAGLEAIRVGGGMTIVQDPSTALAPQMATSAIQRGAAGSILPLVSIASLLRDVTSGAPASAERI